MPTGCPDPPCSLIVERCFCRGINQRFTTRDIEILERLIGVEAETGGRDLKSKYLEEAGTDPLVIPRMHSLPVELWQARAKALFGSDEVEKWKPPQNVLAKHAKDVFPLSEIEALYNKAVLAGAHRIGSARGRQTIAQKSAVLTEGRR
jgi:hypothetical protein